MHFAHSTDIGGGIARSDTQQQEQGQEQELGLEQELAVPADV